jgi:hypothetical protein
MLIVRLTVFIRKRLRKKQSNKDEMKKEGIV